MIDETICPGGESSHNKLISLLDYLENLEKLNRKPHFRIAEHKNLAIYQDELLDLPGIEYDLVEDDERVWLRINRLHPQKPPTVPAILQPWMVLSDKPSVRPQLRELTEIRFASAEPELRTLLFNRSVFATYIPKGDPEPENLTDNDSPIQIRHDGLPGIETAFQAYLEAWESWARGESHRRETIQRYDRLFNLMQSMETTGAENPLELVWGCGMVIWKRDNTPISYPLLTQVVEAELETATMAILVRPRDRVPLAETDLYYHLEIPGARVVTEFASKVFEQAETTFSPFDLTTYQDILRFAASHLDTSGIYWPDKNKNIEDKSLPTADAILRITDTWVLFARSRSTNVLTQDIRNLKTKTRNQETLEAAARALVEKPADTVINRPRLCYRGISSAGIMGSDGSGSTSSEIRELYFPRPFNEAQVSIIERLEHADGVVVQGPPGTGKTHTIANIICHYLAQGKRVLVTSNGEPALAVLRDHIPEAIRPLTISLLTNERDGLKQLEYAVSKIAAEVGQLNPGDLDTAIQDMEIRIDKFHQQIAALDHDLRMWAEKQLTHVPFLAEKILPEELAKRVVVGREAFGWFPDELGGNDGFTPQFSANDIDALRLARRTLGKDIQYLEHEIPIANELATGEAIEHIHLDLLELSSLDAQISEGDIPRLVGPTLEASAKVEQLHQRTAELIKLLEATNAEWLTLIRQDYETQDGNAALHALDALLDEIAALGEVRRPFIARSVVLSESLETSNELFEAVQRAAAGKRPFSLFSGQKEVKQAFQQIRLDDAEPSATVQWKVVLEYLEMIQATRQVVSRWNALCHEFHGPVVMASGLKALHQLERLGQQVLKARTLGSDYGSGFLVQVRELLAEGFSGSDLATDRKTLQQLLRVLELHLQRERLQAARRELAVQKEKLLGKSGPVVDGLAACLDKSIGDPNVSGREIRKQWTSLIEEVHRLGRLKPQLAVVRRVTSLIQASGASRWAQQLRETPGRNDEDRLLPHNWLECWIWAREAGYLKEIDARNDLRHLTEQRLRAERDLQSAMQRLVALRTWLSLHNAMTNLVKAALQSYMAAIRSIGKGTGIRATRYRKDAKKAMLTAHRAVPCWVMPHWRVSESLPAEFGLFDLVIVDEASQSDAWAVPSLLRGKKLLVVGDDKQVSPVSIGVKETDIIQLREQYLSDLPFGHMLLPGSSIYDLAKVIYASDMVVLREHFRCVESIIQFSNRLAYNGEIIPLRLPKASERLDPPLIDVFVKSGYRRGKAKLNKPEAHAIVEEIRHLVEEPGFAGRTIGVVSLLGFEQAKYIQERLTQEIGEEKIVEHKVRCGDAMTFQGKEADVVMISMVTDSKSLRAQSGNIYEQRYNVAASRARDRLYIFRSFTREQVSDSDLRAKLLDHFACPLTQEPTEVSRLRELCESDFERSVYDALTKRGYRVTPQVRAGAYRIDLVVEGTEDRRLAIELDGDQYHTPDRWAQDIARQRVLERVGWRFWRCWGSSYLADPEGCLEDLFSTLADYGIEPIGAAETDISGITEYREVEPSTEEAEIDEDHALDDLASTELEELLDT